MARILMTCGETSGEEHASLLVSRIKEIDSGCQVKAVGGKLLEESGAEILFQMEEYAFMGFLEILVGLPRIISLERELKKLLRSGTIDLFIPVDYPGLNMRIARYAKKQGIPVLYFISPQVWAWGGWRIRKMKRIIDLMAVILPFEEKIYREAGIPVFFTGHPMTSTIPAPPGPKKLPGDGEEVRILLFPGSRKQEVERHLPAMAGAARIIRDRVPSSRFRLGLAPLIDEDDIRLPADLEDVVEFTRNGIDELGSSSMVIASSGTVTLQSALSGTPTIVVYRTSRMTYAIGKSLVRIPDIAMPNVLAGRRILPELLQGDVRAERIADEALKLLSNRERYSKMSEELLGLRGGLEKVGGLERLAGIALEMCGSS